MNARLLAELTAQGEDDIIVRDEYAEYPNFSVNADTEHELLEAADRVILQFPFYWYSSPALLKEWEDEVITAGWAYAGAHALKGKELKLVVTTGSDAAKYRKDGEYSHTMEELLSPFEVVEMCIRDSVKGVAHAFSVGDNEGFVVGDHPLGHAPDIPLTGFRIVGKTVGGYGGATPGLAGRKVMALGFGLGRMQLRHDSLLTESISSRWRELSVIRRTEGGQHHKG